MSVKPMTIGMDYDDTFSSDPDLFLSLCMQMRKAGHTVIGVTLRNRGQLIDDLRFHEACEAIIYCAGFAKRKLAEDLGYFIDVWVDDRPEYIVESWATVNGMEFEIDPADMVPHLLEPFVIITEIRE